MWHFMCPGGRRHVHASTCKLGFHAYFTIHHVAEGCSSQLLALCCVVHPTRPCTTFQVLFRGCWWWQLFICVLLASYNKQIWMCVFFPENGNDYIYFDCLLVVRVGMYIFTTLVWTLTLWRGFRWVYFWKKQKKTTYRYHPRWINISRDLREKGSFVCHVFLMDLLVHYVRNDKIQASL
jgi:hypothetical protein